MDFSVLMSVYKKEKPEYLKECMDSLLKSTVLPTEIIIVKDGELTEELDRILDEYKSKNDIIKFVPLSENCGLGKALNIGLEHCQYELVARMDTDDLCVPERFEIQLKAFENNSDVSLVGGYITEFIGSPENVVSVRKVPLDNESVKRYGKKRNPLNHMTVMFKKSDVLEVGSYQKVSDVGYEDYDLWIRLIMADKKIINLDKVIVNARVGRDMYKRRGDKKRLKTALLFRKKLWETGYCSFWEYILYSAETIVFICVPTFVRRFAYNKLLRK